MRQCWHRTLAPPTWFVCSAPDRLVCVLCTACLCANRCRVLRFRCGQKTAMLYWIYRRSLIKPTKPDGMTAWITLEHWIPLLRLRTPLGPPICCARQGSSEGRAFPDDSKLTKKLTV